MVASFFEWFARNHRSIFETSRLDGTFRIFPDIDVALAANQSSAVLERSRDAGRYRKSVVRRHLRVTPSEIIRIT